MTLTVDAPGEVWRDLLERAIRNEVQAVMPVLVAAAGSGAEIHFVTVAMSVLVVLMWTTAKFFLEWTTTPAAPLWLRLLDRVGSAVAAALIAMIPASWDGTLSAVDWPAVGRAVFAAAAISLIMFYWAPPGVEVTTRGAPRHRLED